MRNNKDFPYPTYIEIVRTLARAFDIKNRNKALDDKAFDRNIDPRLTRSIIDNSIQKPLSKVIGKEFSSSISNKIRELEIEYIESVSKISADGLDRSILAPFVICILFNQLLLHIVKLSNENNQGDILLAAIRSESRSVLDYIFETEKDWKNFTESLDKDYKSMIYSWRNRELPSAQQISIINSKHSSGKTLNIDWNKIKLALLADRAFRYIDTNIASPSEIRIRDPKSQIHNITIKKIIHQESLRSQITNLEIGHKVNFIFSVLEKTNKTNTDKENSYNYLLTIRKNLLTIPTGHTRNYLIDYIEARWLILAGKLEEANNMYKKSFNDCLYRSGLTQKQIIQEALIVAASQKSPDKVFLKNLKWAAVYFGYDIPSVTSVKSSNDSSKTIEDWEIEMWRANFWKTFSADTFFPDINLSLEKLRIGPWVISEPNKIRLDLASPNRTKKVGETWKKRIPQLVLFTLLGRFDDVSALIKSKATVNCKSDSDETPILMALEHLNVTDVQPRSLDKRYFDLIARTPHSDEIINKRSQKLRLLPIISAVQSGIPEVVKTVLKLGADPNTRGLTDEQTPLNVCLKLIGQLKYPERSMYAQLNIPPNDFLLDSIRRNTAGVFGHSLDDQFLAIRTSKTDAYAKELLISRQKRIAKHLHAVDLREIARLLIEHGADVNAEHSSPLEGYTPLMLAAENDERELFELMLSHHGLPQKTYFSPLVRTTLDCWSIAKLFNSTSTLDLLENISRFFHRTAKF
mgnify:CR=1 FL=1